MQIEALFVIAVIELIIFYLLFIMNLIFHVY